MHSGIRGGPGGERLSQVRYLQNVVFSCRAPCTALLNQHWPSGLHRPNGTSDWGAQLRTYAAGRIGAPARPIAADGGSQHIVCGCRGPATAAGGAAVAGGRGGGPAPGGGAAHARRSRARAGGLRGHALAGHGGRQGGAAPALGRGGGRPGAQPWVRCPGTGVGLCARVCDEVPVRMQYIWRVSFCEKEISLCVLVRLGL